MSWCPSCGSQMESSTSRLYCTDCERLLHSGSTDADDEMQYADISPWIEGPPTEPGVYVCQSEIEDVPRFWLATVHRAFEGQRVVAVLGHSFNTGTFKGTVNSFVKLNRITHHIPIQPKEPK